MFHDAALPLNTRSAMTLEERVNDLEIRYAHQEEALEALSRELLEQQRLIERQGTLIETLAERLRALGEAPVGRPEDEPPPPHY